MMLMISMGGIAACLMAGCLTASAAAKQKKLKPYIVFCLLSWLNFLLALNEAASIWGKP